MLHIYVYTCMCLFIFLKLIKCPCSSNTLCLLWVEILSPYSKLLPQGNLPMFGSSIWLIRIHITQVLVFYLFRYFWILVPSWWALFRKALQGGGWPSRDDYWERTCKDSNLTCSALTLLSAQANRKSGHKNQERTTGSMETREILRVLLIIVSLAFRIVWKLLSKFI